MRPYANSDFLLLLEFIVDRNLDHHEKEGKREKLLQVLFFWSTPTTQQLLVNANIESIEEVDG